ncbi:MAG: hypothetical protein U1F43_23790 [Myxococcota bacterium]
MTRRGLSSPVLAVLGAALALSLGACPHPEVAHLVGEDPEVQRILGPVDDDDPGRSALAAARRLHEALMQDDTDTVWGLLSDATRKALDERGAAVATSGRELIDRSMLPGPGGTMRTVRYESILFGTRVADLVDPSPSATGDQHEVVAVAEDGAKVTLTFVHEGETWKLLKSGF